MSGIVVVERMETVAAGVGELLPRIAELPRWVEWSPWEGYDPELRRAYTGEPGSVGSTYTWSGNRKAGAGSMRVTAVTGDGVEIALDFTKPFRSSNTIRFVLAPVDGGTRVTWRMESPKTFMSRIFNVEKLVGPDFEKGLRQLRTAAEG